MAPSRPTLTIKVVWDHRRKVWHIRAELQGPGKGSTLVGSRVADTTVSVDGLVATKLLYGVQRELEQFLPF